MPKPPHQVLSRKYRPQGFDQLVGQDHVRRILQNALVSGRIGHAYLFVGPRGVGKTTTARIFAKAVNCARREPSQADPCGACPSCLDITSGNDLDVVEIDGASHSGVDDVRALRERVGYAAVRSQSRIWIVDEVHMLSAPAFNAFLKTLEEPPPKVVFLFCTTEEHKLPETFRSRCQRVEFRPIGEAVIVARLGELAQREGVQVEPEVFAEIARTALGGLRDAESLLEQLVASSTDAKISRADLDALSGRAPLALLTRLHEAVGTGDAGAALDGVDACLASGTKPGVLLDQWLDLHREAMLSAARGGRGSLARAARAIEVLLLKRQQIKQGAEGLLVLQVAAVELARLPDARDLDRLIEALASPAGSSSSAAQAPTRPATARVPAPPRPSPSPSSPSPASPSPASPPGPPPSAPNASVALASVLEKWPALLDALGGEDPRLSSALRDARPAGWTEGGSVLRLETTDPRGKTAFERREAVLQFRRAARAVLGREVAPEITVVAPSPGATPSVAAAAAAVRARPSPREDRDHPKVRLVTETTDGTLLDVRPAAEEGVS